MSPIIPPAQRQRVNPRRTNGTKRDRLRARVLHEESACHLCGQPVDKRLPHGRPGSPEVDELIPVKLGGSPYDRRNCRLAHRWCNRYRWHKPYLPARAELHATPPRFDQHGELATGSQAEPPRSWTSRDW